MAPYANSRSDAWIREILHDHSNRGCCMTVHHQLKSSLMASCAHDASYVLMLRA